MTDGSTVSVLVVVVLLGVVAYVRYRARETGRLGQEAEVARALRTDAADDPVRLAAINEFETRIHERLFYAANVGPRARSAAWSLLGVVVSGGGLLAINDPSGAAQTIVFWAIAVVGLVFVLSLLVFGVLAVHAATSLPRISFAESYDDAEESETPAASTEE